MLNRHVSVIHGADLHIGLNHHSSEIQMDGGLFCLKLMLDMAVKVQADFVLLAGDVFEAPLVKPDLLKTVIQVFQQAAVQHPGLHVVCVTGNHDASISHSLWQILADHLESVMDFRWCDDLAIFEYPDLGVRLWATGFKTQYVRQPRLCAPGLVDWSDGSISNAAFHDICKSVSASCSLNPVLELGIAHADLDHMDSVYQPISRDMIEKSQLDYLALGHIHKPDRQIQYAGRTAYAYSGAPLARLNKQPSRVPHTMDVKQMIDQRGFWYLIFEQKHIVQSRFMTIDADELYSLAYHLIGSIAPQTMRYPLNDTDHMSMDVSYTSFSQFHEPVDDRYDGHQRHSNLTAYKNRHVSQSFDQLTMDTHALNSSASPQSESKYHVPNPQFTGRSTTMDQHKVGSHQFRLMLQKHMQEKYEQAQLLGDVQQADLIKLAMDMGAQYLGIETQESYAD